MHSKSPLILIAVMAALCAASCARTPAQTAGLLEDQVVVEAPTLIINPRTEWILAVPDRDAVRENERVWVTIERAGERKLFLAVARDEVAYELHPVSAASLDWVRAASKERAKLEMHDTLDGVELTHPVGYLETGDGVRAVKWLGGAPDPRARIVALSPTRISQQRFSEAVVAVGRMNGASFLARTSATIPREDRLLLLVPDGRIPEDKLVVGWVGGGHPLPIEELGEGIEVRDLDVQMPREPAQFYTSVAAPMGLGAGVDVVMWEYEGRIYLASSDQADAMLGQEGVLPAAIAEEVMVAENIDAAARLLEAFASFREGSALGALYFVNSAKFSSRGEERAGKLRGLSLMGDASRAQWMLSEVTREGEELDGATLFYLMRALASEGDVERVLAFAPTARGVFARWPAKQRWLALGRTDELVARVMFARQEKLEEAFKLSLSSAKSYEHVGDFLAVARVELLRAAIASQLEKPEEANIEAKRARSHAYHGNDIFSTAESELELAELYLGQNKFGEAAEVSSYALARMKQIGNKAGINRASVVVALVAQHTEPGSVALADFEEMFRVAEQLRDDKGMASAASAILLAHGGESLEELAAYGKLLGEGRGVSGTPSVVRREQAFASICAQGLLTYVEQVDPAQRDEVARSCERAVARYKVTPMLVASWITRGWSDWMRGRKEQVASLLGQLSRTLDDDWRARNPEIAIHAALLESVATGKTDAEQIDTVLAMMANIDGARRAPYCAELAHAMNARGQQDIALRVLSVGALHARAARQQALVQELTLTRLDALASASRFEDLKVARKEAELRFQKDEIEQGVPGARLSLAALQIALHEGDSKGAEAAFAQIISRAKNIEAPVQMAILDDTAEALLGGDRAGLAVSALDRVESLGAGLPVELSHSLEAKRQLGVAKYLRAAIAASKGDRLKVRTFAASASELLADDPAPQASAYRARALHLMGAFESSATGREAILEELVRLQKLQEPLGRFLVRGGKDQAGVVATLRARAALLYIDGRADEALEVLDELAIAGISPRLDAGQASCERGIYTAMSGQTETGRELLRACAASGGGWEGAQATTWEFLLGAQPLGVRRQALERTLTLEMSAPTPRDREQFEALLSASAFSESALPAKIEAAFAAASSGEKKAKATEAYVDALLDRGKVARASEVLEASSGLFYELDGEWPAHLVRLRGRVHLVNLRPDKNISYLSRAQAELPLETPAVSRAEIALLGAQSALAAGQWGVAAKDLGTAYQYAKEADEKSLLVTINALSERFSIPIKAP